MSTTPNDGGPAFPIPPVGTGDPRDGMTVGSSGMTLRDYFSAVALQGLRASPHFDSTPEGFALESYRLADAMLAERAKAKGGAS